MNKRFLTLIFVLVIVIIVGGLYFYFQSPRDEVQPTGEVKNFSISVMNWEFNMTRIEVNAGDSVRLTITGLDDGSGNGHGFALSKFRIHEVIRGGETITVEFIADSRGTFTFRCSIYCGSGHDEMTGILVVS